MRTKVIGLGLTLLFAAGTAHAGRGSSPGAIRSAIASNSVDAISAELERAEHLVCGSCIDQVRPLVDHPDARVRKVAGWWLARRGLRGELFVEMANRLGQPDSRKAEAAADVLGGLRHPLAAGSLGAALNNPRFDADARVAMAAALGRIGDPVAAGDLAQAAGDADARVRAAAVGALRELRGEIDPGVAIARLADPAAEVRSAAIYTLGATRGRGLPAPAMTSAATALARLVREDTEASVRRKAAWALGEIAAPAGLALAPLSAAAGGDADPAVRSLASVALSKLGK